MWKYCHYLFYGRAWCKQWLTGLEWAGSCCWLGFSLSLIRSRSEFLSPQHTGHAVAFITRTSSAHTCHIRNKTVYNHRLIPWAVNYDSVTREGSSHDTYFPSSLEVTTWLVWWWFCVCVCLCDGGGVNVWASERQPVNTTVEERGESSLLLSNEIQC